MARYIVKRLLAMIPVLIGVSLLIFSFCTLPPATLRRSHWAIPRRRSRFWSGERSRDWRIRFLYNTGNTCGGS